MGIVSNTAKADADPRRRTARMSPSPAAKHDLDLGQLDMASAFLNTSIDRGKKLVYVELPNPRHRGTGTSCLACLLK